MQYPEGYFIRVTDDVKPRREYTIAASSFQERVHKVLEKPAVAADGTALPPKYTPEAMGAPDPGVPPTELPPYGERTIPQLRDEIETRNQSRPEDAHLSKSGNKAALVAVLEADDAAPPVVPAAVDDPDGHDDESDEGDAESADHESLSSSGQTATTTKEQ